MKKIIFLITFNILLISCFNNQQHSNTASKKDKNTNIISDSITSNSDKVKECFSNKEEFKNFINLRKWVDLADDDPCYKYARSITIKDGYLNEYNGIEPSRCKIEKIKLLNPNTLEITIENNCNYGKTFKVEILDFKKDKIGIWKIIASSKFGEWVKGKEFTYTKKQLNNNYKNATIEFTEYDITVDNIKPYYICGSNFKLSKETLDFNLNGTDEDRKNVKSFLKKEFNLSEIDFKGVYNTNCETPFHTIFDFGDKLLVREWGTYYYLFEKQEEIKQPKTEGYNCKDSENQNIYEEPLYKTCECDFDFSKCYSIFYNNSDDYYKKKLLKNLPMGDVKPSSGFAGTYYKFYKKDSLEIIIQEDGGTSSYLFKKINGKTVIECYADAP